MMPGQKAETISILHFNDVYNVESREIEPVGGAARLVPFFTVFHRFTGNIKGVEILDFLVAVFREAATKHP